MGFSDPTKDKETEEQLVKDLQAGEMGSFEQLANLYQEKIYSLSFNLTRNATDSQDVTQEVLLTLFRKGHTFQGKSAFSSWVYRITLNASYMKLRSRKREPNVSIDDLLPSFNKAGFQQEKIQDWSESTESLLFDNETREVIQKAVDLLPDKEKVEKTDDDFDSWDDEEKDEAKYWFTRNKIDRITQVHDYLDNLQAVGKVISFASMVRVVEDLNEGKKLQGLEMGVLYTKIPDSIKKEIIDPYISIENNEARISLRVLDSKKDLRRNELIKKINYDLENQLGLKREEFKLAGVLILFNNLLQSLFKSQILTLGIVMAGITIMFLILFRNITLSLIGVVPNFLAAFFILGIIGLLEIPLDMMTITIAAITIGIAVDNSIHYIYRFREEFQKNKNYNQTIDKCHSTVGIAILNTSITIVFGFSILFLSNFIPTIYFGIFTGIAMLLALISVLTLLPKLILLIQPFGKAN